ncbi:MAG: hypothetical protein ACF8XB_14120 [Planctomycetota bacterium JB042]
MTFGLDTRSLSWKPLDDARIARRVDEVLVSWADTPYMPGQQSKQQGVDCIRFVCAAFDELFGMSTPIPRLPPDTALHCPEKAVEVVRLVREIYAPNTLITDGTIEPGDVIVTRSGNSGPGHALIAGGRENTVWHASRHRVKQTGIGLMRRLQNLHSIIRIPNKRRWLP